jgi:hypothetical protein
MEHEKEQVVRIFTSIKAVPLQRPQPLAQVQTQLKTVIKPQQTGKQPLSEPNSDEALLLTKANSIFDEYEIANLKLKKTCDHLATYASQTTPIDLHAILEYKTAKEDFIKEKQKEATKLYETINQFLIGKKAILLFFSTDSQAFGQVQITKINQDINNFEDVLKKLAIVSSSSV